MSVAALARGALPAVSVAAALLAVAPAHEAPFSAPKRFVLAAATVLALAALPWARRVVAWPLLAAAALTVAPAALAPYPSAQAAWPLGAAGLLAFAWAASGVKARWLVPAATAAGAVAALVALAQAAGADVFLSLGPQVEGARLRVYGTLGNPDFVASVLAVVLCLAAGHAAGARGRAATTWAVALAVLLAGLAVTRSYATVLALGVAGLAAAGHRWRHRRAPPRLVPTAMAEAHRARRRRHLLTAALAVVGLAALAAPLAGRSPSSSAAGRWYLWTVVAPHALDAPLWGLGPGAVEGLWPVWEVELWRGRCGADAACVAAHPQARFTALQDHAHDDWLEVLVERGVFGLVGLVLLFALPASRAWRAPGPRAASVVAALACLAARATVDFPLARPADLCLLAAVVGLAFSLEDS